MLETVSGAVQHANAFLGLRIMKATKAEVAGEFFADHRHLNNGSRVAGMALMAFAEALGATGILLNLQKGMSTATIESKTNFLKAATRGLILGHSIPLHLGRNTMVWQTTIMDDEESRLAIVTQTQIVLPATGSNTPSVPLVEAPQFAIELSAETGKADSGEGTRQRVLAAATKVILRKGFAGASMRDIATAAGLSVSSLYQYVESKDDLLTMIFDSYFGEIVSTVAEASYQDTDASRTLRAAIQSTLMKFTDFGELINLMNREARALKPAVRKRVLAHMDRYVQVFCKIVENGVVNGEFNNFDPQLVAHFIVMLCEVWLRRHSTISHYGREAVSENISRLLLDGLRTRSVRGHD